MKKLLPLILGIIFILLLNTAVFAADIKIESAQRLDSGKVKVVCAVTSTEAVQTVTVISYEAETDLSSLTDITDDILKKIIHIDQFEAEISAQNKIEFEFDPAEWTSSEKTYVVKVGGAGIADPDVMIIKNNGGELEFIFGDADGDNNITASDAAYVLQNALVESAKMPIKSLTENWFKYVDVDGDGYITAADALEILQKSLLESYKMPIEK